MTIFLFALIRAARQRMTESELTIATGLAEAADAGSSIAEDVLKRMALRILFDRNRLASPTQTVHAAHGAVE